MLDVAERAAATSKTRGVSIIWTTIVAECTGGSPRCRHWYARPELAHACVGTGCCLSSRPYLCFSGVRNGWLLEGLVRYNGMQVSASWSVACAHRQALSQGSGRQLRDRPGVYLDVYGLVRGGIKVTRGPIHLQDFPARSGGRGRHGRHQNTSEAQKPLTQQPAIPPLHGPTGMPCARGGRGSSVLQCLILLPC